MSDRIPITKKMRFRVFKRDGFTCQYCGRKPPEVVLEIDHMIPVSANGDNSFDNLLSACFDCNRGKSNEALSELPATIAHNLEVIKERQEQVREYNKHLESSRKSLIKDIDAIECEFQTFFPDCVFVDAFKFGSIKAFLEKIPVGKMLDFMETAGYRTREQNNATDTIKYFCGMCWRYIKEGDCKHER